jgi:hypothetical protein
MNEFSEFAAIIAYVKMQMPQPTSAPSLTDILNSNFEGVVGGRLFAVA